MYCWNLTDCEDTWYEEPEETIEACLEAARESNLADYDGEYDSVYIGKVVPFIPHVPYYTVIDEIAGQANDCGEVGGDWECYDPMKKDEIKELEDNLTEVTNNWLKKYHYWPNFATIEDIEVYKL